MRRSKFIKREQIKKQNHLYIQTAQISKQLDKEGYTALEILYGLQETDFSTDENKILLELLHPKTLKLAGNDKEYKNYIIGKQNNARTKLYLQTKETIDKSKKLND